MLAVGKALSDDAAGATADSGAGYRSFVEPAHPLVLELVGPEGAAPGHVLERSIDRIRRRFVYHGVPGRRSLDELWRQAREPGDAPVKANCISLSCLLASCLRASGLPSDRVYVALGGVRAYPHFHAWVIVRREGGFWSIDPSDLRLAKVTGRALWRRYRFFTLFNDQQLVFLDAEKRELILGPEGLPGVHLVLFGAAEPAVMAALARPELRSAVERLLRGGDLLPGSNDEASRFREWEACGLLRSDGGRYRAAEKLVLIPSDPIDELQEVVAPHFETYLDVVATVVSGLRRTYERCDLRGRWAWPEVVHPLVSGMLMDLFVGWRLHQEGAALAPARAAVVWAFEGESPRGAFGVQWVGSRRGGPWLGQLWHGSLRRELPRLTSALLGELARAADSDRAVRYSKDWLYLRHLGLARAEDGGCVLAVPAFGPRDSERLREPLEEGAACLVKETVKPALAAAEGLQWWAPRLGDPRIRHAVLRRILEGAAERVLDAGLVPPFPDVSSCAPGWGRWLWVEPDAAAPAAAGAAPGFRRVGTP